MQTDQAEHLRQLINSSTILSPQEKGEWLDMLILMNDKQAAELEVILKAPKIPAPVTSPTAPIPPKPISPQSMPSLSHISNLPAGFGAPTSAPARSVPSASPTMPWQKQFQATMTEKELPAPTQRAPRPLPPLPTRPTPTPPPSAPSSSTKFPSLETLTDAGSLTIAIMRNMVPADLLVRLQQLSKMEGYFNLLSYLEDSPLYKSYIATGQKVLASKTTFDIARNDPQLLTKAEFETFTDILRKIQIN